MLLDHLFYTLKMGIKVIDFAQIIGQQLLLNLVLYVGFRVLPFLVDLLKKLVHPFGGELAEVTFDVP